MTARISVVIPTYNRAHYLPLSVRSAMAQSLAPAEIIIVDDGSSDHTEEIVSRLSGPIRYVRQANLGPAVARNRGVQEASGDLVALLDSDDVWMPHKLEQQVAILEQRPKVGLVHTAASLIDEDGHVTGEVWGRPEYEGQVAWLLAVSNGINASSVLVRRSLVLEAGGYDERFRCLENWDLWARVAHMCEFAYIDRPLVQYRVHRGNLIRDLERQRHAYGLWLSKHVESPRLEVPVEVRQRAYARFHQGFADAYVHQGDLGIAQLEFLKSLFYQPWQPGVLWRLLRVSTALLRARMEGA